MLKFVNGQKVMLSKLFSIFLCLCTYSVIAETYTIGVEDHDYLPHYNFNGKRCGPLCNALEAFAAQQGIDFEYVSLPVKRAKSWYSFEKLDFKLPDNPYWGDSGTDNPVFSDPIVWVNTATVVLKKNQTMNPKTFKLVAIFDGFIPHEHWQQKIDAGDVLLVEAPSTKLLTQYLFKGLVDGVNSDLETLQYQAAELGYNPDDLVISEILPQKTFAYSLSTIKHPQVIEKFNVFLKTYEPANHN